MAQMAAHLVERVLPWVPTRQWVVSVPMLLRYWMVYSQDLTAQLHTIIRATISQYCTQVPAHRRDQLERLLRSMARGAVALERLHEDARGDLVYTCTKPWSHGTTGITLPPLELLEKLAG